MNSTARNGYARLPSNGKSCTIGPLHVYEVRPRKDHRGVDLISDVLLFGRLYGEPNAVTNAIGYAMHSTVHTML